jgi:diguanylate cyclase (GGDEF)-like protein
MIKTVPLRTGLGVTIILMGLVAIALVFLSAEIYRHHAIENQRAALVDLVELKANDLLQTLKDNAGRLGLEIQHDEHFREAYLNDDRDSMQYLLDNHFHQYFVTAGILKLEKLRVYDNHFELVTESTTGSSYFPAGSACTNQGMYGRNRTGPVRLKPVAHLCTAGENPLLSVIVPIGLRPDGYIQVITDPLHDLKHMETALGMPLKLSLANGKTSYLSENWDSDQADDTAMVVNYSLQSIDNLDVLSTSLLVDMEGFFNNLNKTRNTVILIVGLATILTVLLARLLADKLVVRPLQSLCSQLRCRDRHSTDPGAAAIAGNQVISEFAELKELYHVLEDMSLTDPLTGLANLTQFKRSLSAMLVPTENQNEQHAVCYLDLDRFKIVNDNCGHAAGDHLLIQIAQLFSDTIRSGDLVARIGGDEFAVLLENCPPAQARRIADTFRAAVDDYQFFWEDQPFNIGVSIGVVPFTPGSNRLSDILSAADSACYIAKESGRNQVHYYLPDDKELVQRRDEMRWATRITRALDSGSFELFTQPIQPVTPDNSNRKMHEALVWMIDEDGRKIMPGEFIPAAERYNLMNKIDKWVITTLCKRISNHNHSYIPEYAINLSGQSLSDESFLHFLVDILDEFDIPSDKICFEITETAAIVNLNKATRLISILKSMGIRFSLDDFGSGLSSFAYLKNLHVDYVKIDGSFVQGIATNPVDHKMVQAINQMAHTMDIQTIAECVENEQTCSMLQDMKVDFVQGYYIGRPQPIDKLKESERTPSSQDKVVPLHRS